MSPLSLSLATDFLGLSLIPLWYVAFLFLAFALNWLALVVLLLGDEEAIAARASRPPLRQRIVAWLAARVFAAIPARWLTVPPLRASLAPLLTVLVVLGTSEAAARNDDDVTIQ